MDIAKIIARIKNVLLTPKTEWPVIAAEADSVARLYKNYIVIVAALTPLATFIGLVVFGIHVPLLGTIHVGFFPALAQLILGYAVALGLCYVMALIVNALAPSFGATANLVQALKVAAYSFTAVWVVGILHILPGVGAIVWLLVLAAAVYSIYLMYLGLQHCMQSPSDKAAVYTAVVAIIGIVLVWILMIIVGAASGISSATRSAWLGTANVGDSTTFTPDKNNPFGALVAMGQNAAKAEQKMQAARQSGDTNAQAAAATQLVTSMLSGGAKVEALKPDALKAFLPATLGGMPQSSFQASRQAPIGIQVSNAKASYRNAQGGAELNLEITDTGGAKGIMALAGFASGEQDRQDNNGYEKTWHDGDRMIHEQWNKSGSGEYTVVLGGRFVVEINGSNVPNIDALKAAMGSLNLAGLEALKNQGVTHE